MHLTRSVVRASLRQVRYASGRFDNVKMGPEDPILGLTLAYNKDTHPQKVSLGAGAYRDDDGKPYVLPCVKKAQMMLHDADLDNEYAPIAGVPAFTKVAAQLLFGEDSPALKDGRVASVQSISGTGALRLGGEFLAKFHPGTVYLPKPTWGNHNPIFEDSHLELGTYRYYRPSDCGLDFDGMCEDITKAAPGTVVLHACAHNPTGVDPSPEQWQQLSSALKGTDHLVFLDAAYQGFASGDPVKDAYAVRHFVEQGHSLVITQSFAKNFGLYGHRIGCLHVVCGDKDEADRVMSQLKILARPMYSNPPIHGARIVERVLTDDKLKAEWARDVKVMADRIIDARAALVSALAAAGSTKDWNHITNQIGMFAFTGLTPEQVKRMIDEFHIYLTGNGRISMAGITSKNVQYVAEAMHKVTS